MDLRNRLDHSTAIDMSVVIPTHNRRNLLRNTIEHLHRQTLDSRRYEIIVVFDHCQDGSDVGPPGSSGEPFVRPVHLTGERRGRSAARNAGLEAARGEIVLLLDDDMLADQYLLSAHLEAHQRLPRNVAVCGQIRLRVSDQDTVFSRVFLAPEQSVEGRLLPESHCLPFQFAISGQVSYKRQELLALNGFDESFLQYGWEDIDLSFRASLRGIVFYYEDKAVTLHCDQSSSLKMTAQRAQAAAASAPFLLAKWPQLRDALPMYADKVPVVWGSDGPTLVARKAMRLILASKPILSTMEALTGYVERLVANPNLLRRWYRAVLGSYMAKGYREGIAVSRRQSLLTTSIGSTNDGVGSLAQ